MGLKLTFESSSNLGRIVDELDVPIECPQCGHKTKQSLARLKNDPTFICRGCGKNIKIESGGTARQIADKINEIDRLFDNIENADKRAFNSRSQAIEVWSNF